MANTCWWCGTPCMEGAPSACYKHWKEIRGEYYRLRLESQGRLTAGVKRRETLYWKKRILKLKKIRLLHQEHKYDSIIDEVRNYALTSN